MPCPHGACPWSLLTTRLCVVRVREGLRHPCERVEQQLDCDEDVLGAQVQMVDAAEDDTKPRGVLAADVEALAGPRLAASSARRCR